MVRFSAKRPRFCTMEKETLEQQDSFTGCQIVECVSLLVFNLTAAFFSPWF